MLQYVAAATPAPVLALNPNLFQLDGNVETGDGSGDDWNAVYNNNDAAFETIFVEDPVNGNGDKYFDGGQTKDTTNIPSWLWTTVSQPQDKNDISNAYGAAYRDAGDLIVYVGMDRYASNGAGQVGWWFLQGPFGLTGGPATGAFNGAHVNGDVLVQVDFENGGASPQARVYEWDTTQADNLRLVEASGSCATAIAEDTCAIAATTSTNPAWPFDDKGTAGASNDIPAGGMVEAGINLTDLGLDEGCFATFLAETRSSPSEDSTLSDFAYGSFALCNKPTIRTHAQQDGNNLSTADTIGRINMGESVTDHAALTGDNGTVTGSVKFFVCRDADSLPDCSTGGTQVGGSVELQDGQADSATFTPTQLGRYCFRVEYTPAAGSKYLADSHTNKTTECFRVIPADVRIQKTAGQSSVSAGSPITFTLSWGNVGEGKATGVVISDDLPGTAGLDWSIQSSTGTGSTCAISGAVGAQVLTCNVGAINGETPASGSVILVSGTTAASCGTIDNTGSITSTNDGSGSASASTQVLCPDIKVTKLPDDGSISAGDTATFTIKVENLGPGAATGVTVSDSLPAGLTWSESEADCSISGAPGSQVLTCNVGSLASGASKTYTVSAPTTKDNCGVIDNTATASATNEPGNKLGNNSDTGAITVKCAVIEITKDADDEVVNAGDTIGFTITVSNTGTGNAYSVTASDTLDPAFAWSLDPSTGWTLVANQLSYAAASLAPGASSTVHLTAPTTAADCRVVPNTATASSGNDGSDSDSAQVEIQCPDVSVVKTAVASPVSAGDPIAFDITVTNLGPGTAYDVTLTDTLPAGITWSENSDACSIAAGVLTCDFGDLADDATAAVRVSGTTSAAVCGTVVNTATVAATNEAQSATTNNSSTDDVVVNCPNVTIEKTADNSPILAGQTASFEISVSNEGPGTAYDVVITDTLPDGLTWSEDSEACSIADGVLTCQVGSLAPTGDPFTVTVSAPTTVAACGDLPNRAEVSASNELDSATEDNSDDATIEVQCASISLVKTAGSAADDTTLVVAKPGNVTFTYVVTNTGTADLMDIQLVDDNATPANTADDITVICPSLTLAAGASMTCTATLPVTYGLRTNIATVTAVPELEPEDDVSATDDAVVQVPQPEKTPRPTPKITPPPTSSLDTTETPTSAGTGLLLVLLSLAGSMLAIGYLIPSPARNPRRNRRG